MEKILSIIDEAYKNDKKITFDMLDNYNLTEEEYSKLFDILKKEDIEIISDTDELKENPDNNDPEILVGESIENAYLKEISKIKLLSVEEERELIAQAQSGDLDARNRFIEANLKLVLKTANKYRDRGLAYLDLVSEGNFGLMRAIETFDLSLGYKFSTYATWWIRQAICRGISNYGRIIRLPVHLTDNLKKVSRVRGELRTKLGLEPTYEQVSEAMGLTVEQIRNLDQIKHNHDVVSLEKPMGEDDDSQLGELIQGTFDVEEEIIKMDDAEKLRQMIDECLSNRERVVIIKRYGLNDNINHTLEEIGREFCLTRERIRQIECKALMKLKKRLQANENSARLRKNLQKVKK